MYQLKTHLSISTYLKKLQGSRIQLRERLTNANIRFAEDINALSLSLSLSFNLTIVSFLFFLLNSNSQPNPFLTKWLFLSIFERFSYFISFSEAQFCLTKFVCQFPSDLTFYFNTPFLSLYNIYHTHTSVYLCVHPIFPTSVCFLFLRCALLKWTEAATTTCDLISQIHSSTSQPYLRRRCYLIALNNGLHFRLFRRCYFFRRKTFER